MKKASELFSDEQRKAVADAVARAEQGTSAEIVPVVASSSGRYDRSEDLFGLGVAIAAVALYWWLGPLMVETAWQDAGVPNTPLWPLLLLFVLAFVGGAALASRVPALRLLFLPATEMREEVERAARSTFQQQRIRATQAATGVLIYVSLYERQVVVLADETVEVKLQDDSLDTVVESIVDAMRNGEAAAGLSRAILQLGEHLRLVFPGDDHAGNELQNGLVLID